MGRKWRHPNTSCPGTQWNQARLHGLTHPTSLSEKHAPTPILVLNPVHRNLGLSSKRKLGSILDFASGKRSYCLSLGHPWRLFPSLELAETSFRHLPPCNLPPSTRLVPFRSLSGSRSTTLWLVCFCSLVADFAPDVCAKSPPTFPYSPRCPHQPT